MTVACAECETDYRTIYENEAVEECPCCGCKEFHFICQVHKIVYHFPETPNEYGRCPYCEQDELEKAKQS